MRVEVDGEDVKVFVAGGVLRVEDRLRIVGPSIGLDSAALVGSDGARVVLADGLHPHLQDAVIVGREPGEPLAIGR